MNPDTPARLLVVDDDAVARESLAELLEIDGYEVTAVANGNDALSTIPDYLPDVILLDVMMPGLDGFTVCEHLKQDPQWQHIPIIMLTALDTKDALIRGLHAGADEFLNKPVNRAELRARIRTMLRIKQQYDHLQDTMKMREDMVHMIIHDMRTPLTVIQMYSNLVLLQNNTLLPDTAEALRTIETQARQLNSFTDDLLVLAKMESGHLQPQRIPVDITQLIAPLKHNYDALTHSLNTNLQFHLNPQPYPIQIDPNLFVRVLDNLLSNAIKYSPEGGKVSLRVRYPQQEQATAPALLITVRDQGPGIPPEYREHIFNKFAVVAAKKQGIRQNGLGLAFCRMAIEAHGGKIYVIENNPQGACFVIEL